MGDQVINRDLHVNLPCLSFKNYRQNFQFSQVQVYKRDWSWMERKSRSKSQLSERKLIFLSCNSSQLKSFLRFYHENENEKWFLLICDIIYHKE